MTFFETVQARGIALSLPLRRYFRSILGMDPSSTALADLRMEQVFADVVKLVQANHLSRNFGVDPKVRDEYHKIWDGLHQKKA